MATARFVGEVARSRAWRCGNCGVILEILTRKGYVKRHHATIEKIVRKCPECGKLQTYKRGY